jgi:hypothetical protein
MAIIHCDVVFKQHPPTLVKFKERLEARMGLQTHLLIDPLDSKTDHDWPHIGHVRETGTLECDEAEDSDMEVTVGSGGVRLTFMAETINEYFRDSSIAALVDLGGTWGARLSVLVMRKWAALSLTEKKSKALVGGQD